MSAGRLKQLEEEHRLLLAESESTFEDQWIIHYPEASTYPTGVGHNVFDFKAGNVKRYDGSVDRFNASLTTLGHRMLKSLYFWSDIDCSLIFGIGNSRYTRKVNYDQCLAFDGVHIPFDYLDLAFDLPGSFELVASTSVLGWSVVRLVTHQIRYASGTTAAAMTPVQWQAGDQAGLRSSSNAAFTAPTLHVPNLKSKTFIVVNTDPANTLNVNLQGKNDAGSTNWFNDPSTGASSNVAAGASVALDISTAYHLMRLRVQNGSGAATYEIQYIGSTV